MLTTITPPTMRRRPIVFGFCIELGSFTFSSRKVDFCDHAATLRRTSAFNTCEPVLGHGLSG
jgi:hypothetical protein